MYTDLKKEMLRHIDEHTEDILGLCSEMVKMPSENPPGDMTEIASFIKTWLEDHGSPVQVYESEKGKVNIVAVIGENESPSLILNGHMDVVPAGDPNRWSFPPFCGDVREGRILGRGTTDMKGGLASIMMSFVTVLDVIDDLPGKLVLNVVPDEETGGEAGTKWCLENSKVHGDACLIGEPTGTNGSFIGEKGICWLRLVATGTPAHGSLPILGDNAIEKLVKAFPAVRRLEKEPITIPSEILDAVEVTKKFYKEMAARGGISEKRRLDAVGDAIDHFTVNIGAISGGVKVNIVPESCKADIDIRVPSGTTSEGAISRLKELLKEARIKEVDCQLILESDSNYTSPDETIYRALKENVKEVLGAETVPLFVTGGTDGRYFRLAHIPTVSYGPGEISSAHSYNEYVLVDDLIHATKVVVGTIADFMSNRKE